MEHSRAIRIYLDCLQEVIHCSVFHVVMVNTGSRDETRCAFATSFPFCPTIPKLNNSCSALTPEYLGIHPLKFGIKHILLHPTKLTWSSFYQLTLSFGSSPHLTEEIQPLHLWPQLGTRESQSSNTTSATNRQWRYVMVCCLTFQDAKRLWWWAIIAMKFVPLEDWENKNEEVRPLWWHK